MGLTAKRAIAPHRAPARKHRGPMHVTIQRPAFFAFSFAAPFGLALAYRLPFPEANALLQLMLLQKPYLFYAIKWSYLAMLFTTPYICASLLVSLVYIFVPREQGAVTIGKLPRYPEAAGRDKLFLVLGEVHHPKRPEPAQNPYWMIVPE